MRCDRRLLSDYLDGELPSDLDREVGEHLLTCESCRQVVQEYRRLGRELRQMPMQPVPATVEARIRERLIARRPSPLAAFFGSLFARPLIPALGAVAATLLVAFAVLYQQIRTTEPEVVTAYAQDGGIDVVFDRPVDASTSDWVVVIDPPADVKAEVVGNKVELRPEQPLQPDTKYTVVIEQKKATAGVAVIAPQQPPVTINFSTGTQLASASPTSSPTPKPAQTASPTAAKTPTSVAIAAAIPATPTPSRPTPTVVPLQPTVAKATPGVPLEACMSDVNPTVARLLTNYPDAERRLVCAVEPAQTPTVAQQSFADGIFISVSRDEAYVLATGPNPGDRIWTGYGNKARVKTGSPTATPTTAAPTTVTPTAVAATVTPAATLSQATETPVAVTAATVAPASATPATTPTAAATTPAVTPAATATPAATPASPATPGPTDTPKPAATPTAASPTVTPASIQVGKEARRVLGDPGDVEDSLGAPTSAEVSQPAVVQDLAGGTVITYRGDEGYVLLADGHWERVVAATATPTATPQATHEPAASPSPTARRRAATATATQAPATLTPTATPTPAATPTPGS